MTKVLIVSATAMEIDPTLQFLRHYRGSEAVDFIFGKLQIDVCITGVGMVNTAFELGKLKGSRHDFAINAGVAGSFAHFKTGDVVNVIHDCFSELGAEDDQNFLSIDDLGFGTQKLELQNLLRSKITDSLPKALSITVNKVHGNEDSIKRTRELHQPDIESMEGAAFIHAANAFGWRAIQLRAISNRVERRNRDKWDVPSAIKNLNAVLLELIKDLNTQQS